jgi:phenolic acid decarboxylase
MSGFAFAGKTIEFKVDNGAVFHNTYAADGTALHYEAADGPAKGAVEDVRIQAAEVAPGVYLVGWTEASGMTITHAMDFNEGVIHAFWTYETENGRVGELHSGPFRELA